MGIRRFIGLMSGTSCDGMDAALVEVEGRGLGLRARCVGRLRAEYPEGLRQALLGLMAPAATTTEALARAHALVGEAFAETVVRLLEATGTSPGEVSAAGFHGQTVCHLPPRGDGANGVSLQIGDAARIAASCGIPVVSDFRAADLALGGQGAPLVPWTDWILFRAPSGDRVMLNLGGIANLTHLPAGAPLDEVAAWDTGPGCMVLDEIARRWTGDPRAFDRDGGLSRGGTPDEELVERLLGHPFFSVPPPRSAGREEFGRGFADRMWEEGERRALQGADLMATAARLTARSVGDALRRLPTGERPVEVLLCGGGSRNPTLVEMLREERARWRWRLVDELGIPAESKEAVSFALLAAACLDGEPANLPQVTGASRPCVLGKITPGAARPGREQGAGDDAGSR
jgi:anhydro-N-acetylmuramic acid kinase